MLFDFVTIKLGKKMKVESRRIEKWNNEKKSATSNLKQF